MYATDSSNTLILPRLCAWCGFDMEVNDWVSPDGKGRHADVEFFHDWDGKWGEAYNGSIFKIRFPDRAAGVYPFTFGTKEQTCGLLSPYHADPKEVYEQKLAFVEHLEGKWFTGGDFPKGTGYIFRTRTRFDAQGHMIGARYGKLYPSTAFLFFPWRGGYTKIRLCYYLNPTENDTNLESDPKKNLFRKFRRGTNP